MVGFCLLTAPTENALPEALDRGVGAPPAAPKRLAAAPRVLERTPITLQTCDGLRSLPQCFDVSFARTPLNPASFFDRRAISENSHYFLKLYRNESATEVDTIVAMGFESWAERESVNRFDGAGAIFAGADAVFPFPDALRNLPVADIKGEPQGTMTCVRFPRGIDVRGNPIEPNVILAPGEAAWLVLRFIPSDRFVGIMADSDLNDRPCDYMTIDGGETWYQPDPVHGPIFDWEMTAFTTARALPSAEPPAPTWSAVKKLYTME